MHQLLMQHEPVGDYMGSPTMSEFLYPGRNATIDDLTFENALARMRWPDDNQLIDALATRFDGAVGLTFNPSHQWYLNHVFGGPPTDGGESSAPYSYTWTPIGAAEAIQSARLYVGADVATATAEREIKGVVWPQWDVSINEGDPVSVSLTGFYGDEEFASSLTDATGSIVGKEEPLIYHGGDLQIPETESLVQMREATVSVTTGGRQQRGWNRKAVGAVMGPVDTTLSLQKAYTGSDQLTTSYGNSTAPATSSGVSGKPTARLRLGSPGDHAAQIDLTSVTPESYSWAQVLAQDADLLDDVEYTANRVAVTAESTKSSAI